MTHSLLAQARDQAMDAVAANSYEHRLLINLETPEADSLAEHIVGLRSHGVPHDAISGVLGFLGEVLEANTAEGAISHGLTGRLDRLAVAAHHRAGGERVRQAFTVLGVTRTLRPALRVLRDPDAQRDGIEYVRACATVAEVLDTCPHDLLRSDSVARQLRATAHAQLLRLIEEWPR